MLLELTNANAIILRRGSCPHSSTTAGYKTSSIRTIACNKHKKSAVETALRENFKKFLPGETSLIYLLKTFFF